MIEYTYLPQARWVVAGAVLIALVVFASYYWAKGRRANRWLRSGLSLLRWTILCGLVVCLFDPELIEAVKHQQKSRLAVLLDTSRSMSIKDLPQARLAAAKNWLEHDFAPSAPPNFAVNYYAFNESLAPLPSVSTAAVAGESTGLADSLQGLLSVPSDDPLSGVVLCSDGIENVRPDAEAIARIFRHKGIPIHTLTVGTTNDMKDIILENVQVRRAVPNEAPTRVAVMLRAPGYNHATVPVQVFREGHLVAMDEVTLTGGSQKVELDFTPREKGFQVYEVRIPPQPGEWLTTNNRRRFGLEVIDPTIRVLYMEGTPQQPNSPIPEWKYLKSALESDPHIKVTTLYREFGAKGHRLNVVDADPETGERIYAVEDPVHGFPSTLSALLQYDVVIHSDIRKESFTSEELQNMARLVEEFGGGFVMIGGNSAFGKGGYHRTILDRIIPVAMRQQNDSEVRPFRVHIPTPAWSHPVIALGATREETELIWNKRLPYLYGCNEVDRAKPGAIVLGDDPGARTTTGSRVILAVQTIGKGRSMAFTSDTTRTWGKDFETLWGERINPALPLSESNCDSRYYRQFWVNAVRWLAAGRIGQTNNAVSLELAQSYCAPGQKVKATVRVRAKDQREISNADVMLLVSLGGKTNVAGKAVYDSAQRAYVGEVTLTNAGNSTVSAVATVKTTKLGEDRQLLVGERVDREMADLRARPDTMALLSQISGGKVLSLADTETALGNSVFYSAPPVTVEYRRHPLWDRSWWLATALGLLSVEWAVRRLFGMA